MPGAACPPSNVSKEVMRWRSIAGLDFHVLATLVYRVWTVMAGAVTLLILPLWLTATLQGYYYTFASLLALQVFFELGFNQVIVQLVSHEFAHLTLHPNGEISGDEFHLGRLTSLLVLMRRWYAISAFLFLVIAGSAGSWFFGSKQGGATLRQWLGPWTLLVLATAINLFLSPGLAALEGMGRVGDVARLRFFQSCLGYAGLWILLLSGCGLWASAAISIAAVLCTAVWMRRKGSILSVLARRPIDPLRKVRWRSEIFPFQWRIAVSWVSGYFIASLFTPLAFSRFGAVEAGRLGIALTMFSAVSTVGMSWVNAKAPQLAMHIARGERRELNVLFIPLVIRSAAVTTGASILVVGLMAMLTILGSSFVSRVASLPVLGCLAWSTVANTAIFAMAVYMRAHRQEPMLVASIVTALATVILAAGVGARQGVLPMMFLYAAVLTLVTLPWTIMLFRRYYFGVPKLMYADGN
jgi:hypothetical protein